MGEMGEVAQSYVGGEINVATAELNPALINVYFTPPYPDDGNVYFLQDKEKIDKQVIDLNLSWQVGVDLLVVDAQNEGDEQITVRGIVEIDGVEVFNKIATLAPGASTNPSFWQEAGGEDVFWITTGKHTIAWKLYAQEGESIGPNAPLYVDNVMDYYCYTLPLDAIATEVLVVQGGTEKHWLSGIAEGFTESPVTIEADVETYFKFKNQNAGDEPVKMNVGHLVSDHYETGFLVGGVLVDTVDKDVLILPGETGEIKTGSFTASSGKLTIGSFAVLRARSLPRTFTVTFENSPGDYYNLISVPVFDERSMADIMVGYGGFFAVYQYNAEEQKFETVDLGTPFVPGVGYSIYLDTHAEVEFTGGEYYITAESLIASLKPGFNLIGVGIEPVDISATGYTATYYTPDGTKSEGITLLEPGKAYFIEK